MGSPEDMVKKTDLTVGGSGLREREVLAELEIMGGLYRCQPDGLPPC